MSAPGDASVRREVRYAEGLTDLGMPDYAQMVLDRIQDPKAGALYKVVKLRGLIAMGHFDDVKALIAKEPAQNSQDVWAMKMTLADGFYAWGRYDEAHGIYKAMFNTYPNGPPESLNDFYMGSAYKCAQMLTLMGRIEGAVGTYANVLKAKTPEHVRRQCLTESAELLVKLVEKSEGAQQQKFVNRIEKITNEILWVQDLWFGKAIVILAHVKLLQGDVDGAMKLVDDFWKQLKDVDDSLRRQAEETGEDFTRLSPLVECRYLLGAMMQNEAHRLLASGGDREKVITLLAGKKVRRGHVEKRTTGALQHFLNVFIRYPGTSWAPDAGMRGAQVEELLKREFGAKIEKKVTDEQMEKVRRFQFQNARALYNQSQYEQAAAAYLKVLNLFPEGRASVPGLSDLAKCYIELGNELYADMVIGHLAERFSRSSRLMVRAGDETLRFAELYRERNVPEKRDRAYNHYLNYYRHHPRAAMVLFRLGDERFTAGDMAGASSYYKQIIGDYSASPLHLDAMNKQAICLSKMGEHVEEVKALTAYIEKIEEQRKPGPAAANARYRQAYAYKQLGKKYLASAANRYSELINLLKGDRSRYEQNPEESAANRAILEGAMFQRAACFALLAEPAEKVKTYKTYAIKAFTELVEEFPESEFAPMSLSQVGTLWTVLENPTEARKVLRRLQKEYPESKEAKNALFVLGRSLLELGMKRQATDVFKEMFTGEGKYTERQILSAALELYNASEYDVALEAFDRVLAVSPERAVDERASLGKGKLLIDRERYREGADLLEEMLKKYPNSGYTVEVCLYLSTAYSGLGNTEPDGEKRFDLFNSAIKAMRRARKFETSGGGRARSDVELGKILERKAGAEKEFGTPAKERKYREDAIAAYQTLTLLGDINDPEVRPYMEEAYGRCLPLLVKIERWEDIIEDCDQYLELFPRGRYIVEVRRWKNKAKVRTATETPAPSPAGAEHAD